MLIQYAIPLLITLLLGVSALIIWRGLTAPVGIGVEIIIDGSENPEEIEHAVALARQLAARYFQNATVYIRGQDSRYIDVLCKRYNVLRKN